MRVLRRLCHEIAAEGEQGGDVILGRHGLAGSGVDVVVEAQLEFLVLAEGAERFGDGVVRVEDGEYVGGPCGAVAEQLVDAADGQLERGDGVDGLHVPGLTREVGFHKPRWRALVAARIVSSVNMEDR